MGSVKDLKVEQEPTRDVEGRGFFEFSDRYSVFDWGEMPDNIPGKGAAICMMASHNFEALEVMGVKTHYLGVIRNQGRGGGTVIGMDEMEKPTNKMAVRVVNVVKPDFIDGGYDYSAFSENERPGNFVIPLEVIYRRGAPKGSSMFGKIDRLKKEPMELRKFLANFGLTKGPVPGDLFPKTGYDFTTKFESTDRPVESSIAFAISGLNAEQFGELRRLRDEASGYVSTRAEDVGLVDYDGKHEYIFSAGEVRLGDVLGTLDENRFMLNGRQVSKEFLRQVYKKEQSAWVNDVARAKDEAKEKEIADWKSLCTLKPEPLDKRVVKLTGEMYQAAANLYTGRNWFKARPLERVMEDLAPFYSEE
tara:strand:+ start:5221 stop:6306 length:1086 start_codon:yes stop_codon:yes gene_type:complete